MSGPGVIGLVRTHNISPLPNGYTPIPACANPPRTCNVSSNGLLDWAFAANPECPSGSFGIRCSTLNREGVCFTLTQDGVAIPPIANWWSNQDSGNPGFGNPVPPAQGRYISCEYPLSLFNTAERVDLWLRMFNNGSITFGNTNEDQINKASFDLIMNNYCGQLTYNCPIGPTGPSPLTNCPQGPTGCSILHSNSPGLCPQWFSTLGPTGINNLQNSFCGGTGICATDCLCVNRANNIYYQGFAGGFTGTSTDSCWFKPCRASTGQYIPNGLLNPRICPGNVCLAPIFSSVPTGLSPTGVTEFIFCPVGVTGATGPPEDPQSFWDVNGIYIVLAVTGFIILIIFIIILAFADDG